MLCMVGPIPFARRDVSHVVDLNARRRQHRAPERGIEPSDNLFAARFGIRAPAATIARRQRSSTAVLACIP